MSTIKRKRPLNILVQTRPNIKGATPSKSTDFAIALEALQRGHKVYTTEPKDVVYKNGQLTAKVSQMTLKDTPEKIEALRRKVIKNDDATAKLSDFVSLSTPVEKSLNEINIVLPRQDPPEDSEYITNLQLLQNALPTGVTVAPPPNSLLGSSEKLAILNPAFKEHIPESLVSADPTQLKDFFDKNNRNIVLKPLYDAAGRGVVRIQPNDDSETIIKQSLDERKGEPLMAQEFLSGVTKGDKRVFFIDGDETGAIRRIPPEGSFKVALATGGKAAPAELNEQDKQICQKVGNWLKKHKVQFAGIDLIEDAQGQSKLIEINHTSPTGINPYERFTGTHLAPKILDSIENYHYKKQREKKTSLAKPAT